MYVYAVNRLHAHVSGLLHALVAMCPKQISLTTDTSTPEEPLPMTSYTCQWKNQGSVKKAHYLFLTLRLIGHQVKHTLKPLKDP